MRMKVLWGKMPTSQKEKSQIHEESTHLHNVILGLAAWPIINILVSHH